MIVYCIAKSRKRATDLSGMGAYKPGGRWNNAGTYMLYTSENTLLAYIENLVYFEVDNALPQLFIMGIELRVDSELIYTLPNNLYAKNWQQIGSLANKNLGDELMAAKKHVAVKVKSAINHLEFNCLLNPLFPGYHDLVIINSIAELDVDARLIK